MIRHTKKKISILQLKFLIRFAQALFNPKGNSSKNYIHLKVFGALLWGNLENPGPNTPIHWKGHIKIMKSLQLNISHPTTPYLSCFKVIWGSSVIQYLRHWENLGSLDPNASNQSKKVIHRKPLQKFNSTFDTKWDKCKAIWGSTYYTCFRVFGNWGKSRKTPSKGHR